MNLNIESTQTDEEVLFKLDGELDVHTAPDLQNALSPIKQEGTKNIHIDLTNVNYMDSTGLGIFVGTLKELSKNNKELYVSGASERIMRLFEITGLRDLMHINGEGKDV